MGRILIRRSGMAICLALMPVAGATQGKAPAPEFAVAYNFQETLARLFAQDCANLSFDHDGFDRHVRALFAEYSDRGHHSRRIQELFAPIQPTRYEPYFEAFIEKYDLNADTPDAVWCAAGAAEAEWRTPIGRMLRIESE